MKDTLYPHKNGTLPLLLPLADGRSHMVKIYGGGFRKAFEPGRINFGVCLTEPNSDMAELHMPIRDFYVPEQSNEEVLKALKRTIRAAIYGTNVFVGCAGGWGRTGLFLALLKKATGSKTPVDDVRMQYHIRAVETSMQGDYVDNFEMPDLTLWVTWHVIWAKILGKL